MISAVTGNPVIAPRWRLGALVLASRASCLGTVGSLERGGIPLSSLLEIYALSRAQPVGCGGLRKRNI